MNVALIDMGSNSIRLAVYKVEQKDFEPIFSKRYMTGLASYVKEAVDRSWCGAGLYCVAGCKIFAGTAFG